MKKTIFIISSIALLAAGTFASEALAEPESKCKACHTFEQGGTDFKKAIKDLTGDKHAKTRMGKQKKCGDDAEAVVAFLKTLK